MPNMEQCQLEAGIVNGIMNHLVELPVAGMKVFRDFKTNVQIGKYDAN